MLDLRAVDQLSALVKDLPPSREYEERSTAAVRQNQALELLEGLLRGKSRTAGWMRNYRLFCGESLPGAKAKEREDADENLLDGLLGACNPEVLKSLLLQYGETSKIGRRIKQYYQEKEGNTGSPMADIEQELRAAHPSFYQLLAAEIQKRGYPSDAAYYEKIHFSRQLFSKLRKPDYTLSKNNVLWLTAGLALDYWDTVRLLDAAGYTFRKNSRRDTIVAYVIRNGKYTLDSLNEMLFFFGEAPLGCAP